MKKITISPMISRTTVPIENFVDGESDMAHLLERLRDDDPAALGDREDARLRVDALELPDREFEAALFAGGDAFVAFRWDVVFGREPRDEPRDAAVRDVEDRADRDVRRRLR